ncbi:MAG: lysylphosphatidylglycerol synthase transmembrane domain-containing protein [Nitrospirota bacterium]
MIKSKIASLLVGSLISVVCFWYAFRQVDLSSMVSAISRVGVAWVMLSVLASLLSLVVRAVRWRFLLAVATPVGARSLLSATFIGFMANSLFPVRLGEVIRAWVLTRREQTSMPAALASIVVERLFDVIAALTLFGLGLAAMPSLDGGAANLLKKSGLAVLMLVAVVVAGLLAAACYRGELLELAERWVGSNRPWMRKALGLMHRFLDGLCALRSGWQGLAVFALSFLVWGVAIAAFYVMAEGFHLGLTPVQVTLVFVIVLFGVAVPSAPGFVGTFHGFCVAALVMVAGTEPTLAAAYATLLHGSQWIAVTVVGLTFYLMDPSMTWSSMSTSASRGEGA